MLKIIAFVFILITLKGYTYVTVVLSAKMSVLPLSNQYYDKELDARLDGHRPTATFVSRNLI